MLGGFFDRYQAGWDDAAIEWFEALIEEDDVDVMSWALGTVAVPTAFAGDLMAAMQRLDYVEMP